MQRHGRDTCAFAEERGHSVSMRPAHRVAACGALMACSIAALPARADLVFAGPSDVTTLGGAVPDPASVGDIEPSVVSLADGTVTLAWLRIPTASHVGGRT